MHPTWPVVSMKYRLRATGRNGREAVLDGVVLFEMNDDDQFARVTSFHDPKVVVVLMAPCGEARFCRGLLSAGPRGRSTTACDKPWPRPTDRSRSRGGPRLPNMITRHSTHAPPTERLHPEPQDASRPTFMERGRLRFRGGSDGMPPVMRAAIERDGWVEAHGDDFDVLWDWASDATIDDVEDIIMKIRTNVCGGQVWKGIFDADETATPLKSSCCE